MNQDERIERLECAVTAIARCMVHNGLTLYLSDLLGPKPEVEDGADTGTVQDADGVG
jgi:hypothetical protein